MTSSNKIWIVTRREFASRVRKKSFLVTTILMPVLMIALIVVPMLLAQVGDDECRTVVVIDNTGCYVPAFTDDADYRFVSADAMSASYRSDSTDVYAVLQITGDLVDFPDAAAIYSRRDIPVDLSSRIENVLTEEVRKEKLARYDIPQLDSIINDMSRSVEVERVRWTDDGEQASMAEITSLCSMVLTLLIYFFVLTYGAMVMQSVLEEKTNRIVELMVSSVRPFQLLMGKIVGIGLVGLFQMLIWAVLFAVVGVVASSVMGLGDLAASQGGTFAAAPVSGIDPEMAATLSFLASLPIAEIVVLFVLYFIGGYLLYASILAAFGASVDEQQDSQQFMMPVMIVMILAFYCGFYSVENPEGPLAFWTSFVPFTSPIVMMVRIPFGVPLYQELISVVLLYATALAILAVSAKIYRVGILMYGKKPTWKDLAKWIRYR